LFYPSTPATKNYELLTPVHRDRSFPASVDLPAPPSSPVPGSCARPDLLLPLLVFGAALLLQQLPGSRMMRLQPDQAPGAAAPGLWVSRSQAFRPELAAEGSVLLHGLGEVFALQDHSAAAEHVEAIRLWSPFRVGLQRRIWAGACRRTP